MRCMAVNDSKGWQPCMPSSDFFKMEKAPKREEGMVNLSGHHEMAFGEFGDTEMGQAGTAALGHHRAG